MILRHDWRKILRYAWSIRLMLLAGILSGLEVALPIIDQVVVIPGGVFASLSGVVTMAALVARLVAQKEFRTDEEV